MYRCQNLLRSVVTLATFCMVAPAFSQDEVPAKVQVFPQAVSLTTQLDQQSLIVQAIYANGITRDVTAAAEFALADENFARLEEHTLYPKADGQTELSVSFAGQVLKVPVEVKQAEEDRPISFRLDVMPIFMKSGCNPGSCHGAARGRDGLCWPLWSGGGRSRAKEGADDK